MWFATISELEFAKFYLFGGCYIRHEHCGAGALRRHRRHRRASEFHSTGDGDGPGWPLGIVSAEHSPYRSNLPEGYMGLNRQFNGSSWRYNDILVGGFKHFLFSIIYGNNHPNWLIFFKMLKPPTRYIVRIYQLKLDLGVSESEVYGIPPKNWSFNGTIELFDAICFFFGPNGCQTSTND